MSNDWLFTRVRNLVYGGFASKKDLFDAVAMMEHDIKDDPSLAPKLRGYAAKLWKQAEEEEAGWQGITVNDRIDAAFSFLEEQGIFAAQDFTCCSSCGHSEACGEVSFRQEQGKEVRGYVFYHHQDTDSALAGHGLYLAYGAAADGEEATEAIGREICSALSRYGISHQWDGSAKSRIFIEPFPWRKRRFTQAPPIPHDEPWRVLRHEDGRVWAARILEGRMELRILDSEGDVNVRRPRTKNPNAELERLLQELKAEGFYDAPEMEPPSPGA